LVSRPPPGSGAEAEIINAIKAYPELWRHAWPQEVVIVPREALQQVGVPVAVADVLEAQADAVIYAAAHKTGERK